LSVNLGAALWACCTGEWKFLCYCSCTGFMIVWLLAKWVSCGKWLKRLRYHLAQRSVGIGRESRSSKIGNSVPV